MVTVKALRNTGLAATVVVASLVAPVMAADPAQNQGPSSTQSPPPPAAPMGGHGPMMGRGMMKPGMMGDCSSSDGMGPGMMMPGMGSMMMGIPAQHIEGWIAFLRTELKITDAQTPLFNSFAEALRAAATSLQDWHEQMRSGERPDTWPERLTRHEQMMTAHLEALKKVKSAAIPLYNALSADQRQTADSLPMGMGMGMGMMGGRLF